MTKLTREKLNEMKKGRTAYKAIQELIRTLEMLNNKIKRGEHITFEWYIEHDAEGELYKALRNYEELLRENEKKIEDDAEPTFEELDQIKPS